MTSEQTPAGTSPSWRFYAATGAAVAATAVVGGKAVDADSVWYKTLDKPSWQPPGWAFGVVWTPLYASVAWAAGRALAKSRGPARRRLVTDLATDLALNAGWNLAFFGLRSPSAGVAGTLALDAANVRLLRTVAQVDKAAGRALVPYTVWCGFATALNASIARRHSAGRRSCP
ncbi:TspO/MBR family protein [Streptomyces sp. NPDC021608]|uniref:TspO/MBR family protein n=1 Tax=Streptomyces sp. NPDC021608 TaxID=3154903 RepID=UPI00340D22D9